MCLKKIKINSMKKILITIAICASFAFIYPLKNTLENDVFNPAYVKKVMLKATAWQLKNPKHTLTDWTNGAFYTGVFAAYETTKEQWVLDSLMAMGNRNKWLPICHCSS